MQSKLPYYIATSISNTSIAVDKYLIISNYKYEITTSAHKYLRNMRE